MPHIGAQPDCAAQLHLWSPPSFPPRLAVDWWDRRAQRWRPTLASAAGGRTGILVPRGRGTATARVDPVRLRISELLTDALARHALTRSRLMLLLALAETATSEEPSLRGAIDQEQAALSEVQPVWVTAFQEGFERGLGAPPLPLPRAARELRLPSLGPPARGRAAALLSNEVQRFEEALLGAGWPEELALQHPQVAGIASLFEAAGGVVQATTMRPSAVANAWTTGSWTRSGFTRSQS